MITEWTSYRSRTNKVDESKDVMFRGEVCALRLGEGGRKRFSAGRSLVLDFDLKTFHSP